MTVHEDENIPEGEDHPQPSEEEHEEARQCVRVDEAATIFEEELDADQERQEGGEGVSHAGMKRKAGSDGPELKPWMFGRFGYL